MNNNGQDQSWKLAWLDALLDNLTAKPARAGSKTTHDIKTLRMLTEQEITRQQGGPTDTPAP